ncbi:ATP-binding cassette domain-containing protein [Paenisporosarcina antarctica]|uniref:ABC transporter ATP-binding protein n=1 Tax=Paenisporosarcina antarctica TaxID=417367 RepID=A0A4P6ZUU5_9BACL|nr:ABC transporter ATP-binding protein [Paenisporosarcina antarctica]QBP39738.1 ABC transporter ATP-binding protein [Paenisporosarcina antarctica]
MIKCKDLSKKYHSAHALTNLSCDIKENTITGVIGRNGAGKTTFMKLVAGYLKKTTGEIQVMGENPFTSLKVSANTIFIDDQMSFPTSLNLEELLDSFAMFYPNWNMPLAKELMTYFKLPQNTYIQNLSKGMRSTFHAIIGFAARCPLTIYDEPTTGMDAAVRKDFYRALLKDYLAFPRTILISSHYLDEIENLLEDVLIIHEKHTFLHTSVSKLKESVIGVKGEKGAVESFMLMHEKLSCTETMPGFVMAVVKTSGNVYQSKHPNLTFTNLSANEAFVNLTAPSEGGIDRVFTGS